MLDRPTIEEINRRLHLVLEGKISREDLSDWAEKWQESFDRKSGLRQHDVVVWKCLDTVSGIDLRDSPTSYLHNEEDILRWIESFGNLSVSNGKRARREHSPTQSGN